MAKAILVGRHQLLPAQEQAIRDLGLEIIERVEQIDRAKVSTLPQGVEALVIQAIPLSILADILPVARGRQIKILLMEQEALGRDLLPVEEAEKLIREAPDRRVALRALTPNGEERVRVVEFRRIVEVKDIKIERETVWEIC